MVRGMQEGPDTKYMKMHASLKHYTAYSVETNRAGIDESISEFDLHDTYLPQYQIAFEKGNSAFTETDTRSD
jgi:beta-glucosidase-like glycosyl hydrolase